MSALHQMSQMRPSFPPAMTAEQLARAERRALVREFLRCIPPSEPSAILELLLPDGSIRQLTRGALQQRIKHGLRPRMRRIIERQLLEHASRDQVAHELGVSIKTLERDSQEALDLLIGAGE